MEEIGLLLKEARESEGMSLEDVEQITKIRRRYLEAIENGEFHIIPGEVYLKGFIRNYAEAVGLDEDDIIGRYKEVFGDSSAEAKKSLSEQKAEIVVVEEHSSGMKLLSALIVVLLLIAAGFAFYWFFYRQPETDGALPAYTRITSGLTYVADRISSLIPSVKS